MTEAHTWRDLADRDLVWHAVNPSSPHARELALRTIYDRYAADVLGLCGWWLTDPDAALDAAQSTFEAAIADLAGAGHTGAPTLRDPDKLGAWLGGIARNQCRAEWRRRNREGEFPQDDLEDAEHEVTASRRRRAQVDRMLDTVAASFTERQQVIFRLVLRQGLRGQVLAGQLGISEKEANDATYENQALVLGGFGAYVLARDGRAYCPGLARILDQSAWDGQTFTRVLRLRILRHLDNCSICDNCATCNARKKKLIKPYAPVLVPFLIAAELRRRIYNFIRRICTPPGAAGPGQHAASTPTRDAIAGASADAVLDAVISRTGQPEHARRAVHRRRRRSPHGPRRSIIAATAAVVVVASGIIGALALTRNAHKPPAGSASATRTSQPPQALGGIPLPLSGEAGFLTPSFPGPPYDFPPTQSVTNPVALTPCKTTGFPAGWLSSSAGWWAGYQLAGVGTDYSVRLYPVTDTTAVKNYTASLPGRCTSLNGITYLAQPTHYGDASVLYDGTDTSGRATTCTDLIYADGYLIYIIDNTTDGKLTSALQSRKTADLQYLLRKADRALGLGGALSRQTS